MNVKLWSMIVVAGLFGACELPEEEMMSSGSTGGSGGSGFSSGTGGGSGGTRGGTGGSGGGGQQPALPSTVTLAIEGVVVSLGKSDHNTWDFDTSVIPASAWTALATALVGPNPYNGALGVLAQTALNPTAKPDPYGWVTVQGSGIESDSTWLAMEGQAMQNTFQAAFPQRPGWTGVPLDRDLRFTVQLFDEDISDHDNIGTASFNTADLKTALAAGKVHHVKVADQTQGQLLFIDISVVAE